MYGTLLTKIGQILDTVPEVADHFAYPKSNMQEFPAVYYQPDGYSNRFETGQENMKTYRFKVTILIGGAQTTPEDIFTNLLPTTVDAVIAAFDATWNGGTDGQGHRIYVNCDSAEPWQESDSQDGVTAFAILNVEIKVVRNV